MAKNTTRRELFAQRVPLYQKDPVLFCKEVTGFVPDPWQEAAFRDLAEYPKVSIRSGQGVGKTSMEANALLWFLSCFPYSRVVGTAPTKQQLNDVLWAEVDKWLTKSPLLMNLLTWTKTYMFMQGYERRWFAVAKTASRPENMQGFHEDNMLFIVDEASGVSDEIMEAVLGTLSGENNKLLMCANPTRTTGTFYDSHNIDRAMYRCHKVSSLDSTRTNKENIASFIRKYGMHSNVVRVRVLGEFPEQEDDVFIPLPLIEQSVVTEIDLENIKKITLGVDVARFGDDETVIVENVNGKATIPVVRHGQSLMATVGDIVQRYRFLVKEYPNYKGVITVNIDDTGLGGGVTDRLEEVKVTEKLHRLEIVPVNFGSAVPEDGSENYSGIATYMWASIRTLMENGELAIENDNELVAQLSVRKYGIHSNGKIALESKKEMKKRGVRSPDRADALALSCFSRDKIYSSFIDNHETIIIPYDAIKAMNIMQVNIGVGYSGAISGVSFVATAIINGHKRAVILSSAKIKGDSVDEIEVAFNEFCNNIATKYKTPDYVYCDPTENFLYRCIKKASQSNGLSTIVRVAANDDVKNRIRLTTRMFMQNRLFITDDCESISRALTTATWDGESRSKSADAGMLNAFEYTIEREGARFLASENGG